MFFNNITLRWSPAHRKKNILQVTKFVQIVHFRSTMDNLIKCHDAK